MGNQQTAPLDDDDLLSRATELLQHTHVRKRTRDEPPPPPAMFSAPTFSLPRASLMTDLAAGVGDEYTQAVLDAAATYLSSGGKACKPIGPVSAGSVGRKGVWRADSEPSSDSRSRGGGGCGAHGGETTTARVLPEPAAAVRSVAFRCRRCDSTDRAHDCAEPPLDGGAAANGVALPTAAAAAAAAEGRLRPWTAAEDEQITAGVAELGFKWSHIALCLDGRTDNAVRNRWHRLEAARTWRADVFKLGLECAELPGYKCGRCGQPKRGHVCAYAAEPLAAHADDSREASSATCAADASNANSDGSILKLGADATGSAETATTDEELSALFASLEARQGSGAGLERLIDGLLCPAQLEQIVRGCDGADADVGAASSLDAAEAAYERAVRETLVELAAEGEWAPEDEWAAEADLFEPPSADGAVCF